MFKCLIYVIPLRFCNLVDSVTGKAKGFAFITFADSKDADEAIRKISETEIDGRTVRVEVSTGIRGGGGGGGRDRYEDRGGRDRYDDRDRFANSKHLLITFS